MNISITSAAYTALRHAGAPPARAGRQLALSHRVAFELERMFQARKWGHQRVQRPAFARHDAHVRAVMVEGGFPVLPERSR